MPLEAAAVFVAIMLDIWWIRFHWPLFWIPLLAIVVATHVWRRETPWHLGITPHGFAASLRATWLYVAAIAALMIAGGAIAGTLRDTPPRDAALDIALYCCWGLFQQYLLNGYFVNRIRESPALYPEHRAALCAAALFSIAHTPNWLLMVAAFIGGYAAARVYMRYRNLLILGLAHGLFGFLIYWTMPDTLTRHLYVGPRYWSIPTRRTVPPTTTDQLF